MNIANQIIDKKNGSYLISFTPQSIGQHSISVLLQGVKHIQSSPFYCIVDDIGGGIYAVGGYDGKVLNTVEKYDPRNNTWSLVASMNTVRFGLTVVSLDGFNLCCGW